LNHLRSLSDTAFLHHRIVLMKEAVLSFAHRHRLPPPSWWSDAAGQSPTIAPDNMTRTAPLKSKASLETLAHLALPKSRGREPKRLNRTKSAMKQDIQECHLTASELDDMTEEHLKDRYGVSRDTARKARKAVLLELSNDQNSKNDK
jgi:hypothetical protein